MTCSSIHPYYSISSLSLQKGGTLLYLSTLTCLWCHFTRSSSPQQLGDGLSTAPSLRPAQALSFLQHLLSRSASPVRWCWEQPSLLRPPSSPSLFSLSCPLLANVFFLLSFFISTQTQTSSFLPVSHPPLCFQLFLPLFFSWSVYDNELSIHALLLCFSESACFFPLSGRQNVA